MAISEPRLRSLLRQADKLAKDGKLAAAATLYRQITEEAPESETAWLGLAEVTPDEEGKEAAYRHVLELAPDNALAKNGLAELTDTPLAGVVEETEPSSPTEVGNRGDREDVEEAAVSETSASDPEPLESDDPTISPMPVSTPPAGIGRHREDEVSSPKPAGVPGHDYVVETDEETPVCYRHPRRETSLRCYTCDRPICIECAVKTSVGYRCPECVRELEDTFYTVKTADYLIAPAVALPLSLISGWLVVTFRSGLGGFYFFFIVMLFFVGGAIGGAIARAAKWAVGNRRGRYLPHLVAAMVALGVIVPLLLASLSGQLGALRGELLVPGVYLFVAVSATFKQMK